MKAAIFDMDGTVLDSMGMWQSIVPEFVAHYNIDLTADQILSLKGMNLMQAAGFFSDNFGINLTPSDIFREWDEIILRNYLTNVQPKFCAYKYLCALKELGVTMAIATLTEHHLCEKALEKHDMLELFDVVLTTEDVGGVSKFHPDIFLEAANRLNADIKDCIVFEDSLYAIKTAKAAGFTVWAIADENQGDQETIRALCDRYIEDYSSLLKEIKQATTA